jgi:hypothetical protein
MRVQLVISRNACAGAASTTTISARDLDMLGSEAVEGKEKKEGKKKLSCSRNIDDRS